MGTNRYRYCSKYPFFAVNEIFLMWQCVNGWTTQLRVSGGPFINFVVVSLIQPFTVKSIAPTKVNGAVHYKLHNKLLNFYWFNLFVFFKKMCQALPESEDEHFYNMFESRTGPWFTIFRTGVVDGHSPSIIR